MMVLYVLEDSHLAVVKKKLYSFFQVCGVKVLAVAVMVNAKRKKNSNNNKQLTKPATKKETTPKTKMHSWLPSNTSSSMLICIKNE